MDRETRLTLPDLITVTNASVGFLSITYIVDGRLWLASILILICVILDGLDGALARYMDVEHELGVRLDFFADLISFCLAPALLLYTTYYDSALGRGWESPQNALATLVPFIMVFFGTLRLARFVDKRSSKKNYYGLPVPSLALIVIHLSFLLGWGQTSFYLPYFTLLVVGSLCLILYIPIDYPKLSEGPEMIGGIIFLMIVFLGLLLARSPMIHGMILLTFTTSILLGYVFISPLVLRKEE